MALVGEFTGEGVITKKVAVLFIGTGLPVAVPIARAEGVAEAGLILVVAEGTGMEGF